MQDVKDWLDNAQLQTIDTKHKLSLRFWNENYEYSDSPSLPHESSDPIEIKHLLVSQGIINKVELDVYYAVIDDINDIITSAPKGCLIT